MAKHIIEENIKTIGGKSIVGKGDIEIVSTVKTDGKSISLDEEGALQVGVVDEDELGRVIYIDDGPILFKDRSFGSKIEFNNVGFSIDSGSGSGPSMMVNYAYMMWGSEEGSAVISPGHFSTSSDNSGSFDAVGGKMIISSPFLTNGVPPASTELTPYSLKAEDESKDVNHTFTFPTQAVNNSSTMVVSVNNQVADEKGNITLPATGGRDFEYEKFVRSTSLSNAVYKYDREKMGSTIGELYWLSANVYSFSDNIINFLDENRNYIADLLLPNSMELIAQTVLPAELDNKSFFIELPT
jgi:hypothetical protein